MTWLTVEHIIQRGGGRIRYTAPSQKMSIQTTKKPPARTSLIYSTARKGVTWYRNKRSAALLGGITVVLKKLTSFVKKMLASLGHTKLLTLFSRSQ
jgi:hypothetical protein